MVNTTGADSGVEKIIARFLEQVPYDLDAPRSIDDIVAGLGDTLLDGERLRGVAEGVVSVLDRLGVICWHESKIRAKSQIPSYFLLCLAWYFHHSQTMLANWERLGTARDIDIGNLLEASPYFLKVLEQRRLRLSEKNDLDSGHSRVQPVSVLLIKTIQRGRQYFVHQWDASAEQYQLIGGKVREDETPAEAAERELHEEISEHDLARCRDYELTRLNDVPVETKEVSRTYGALTAYRFWLFSVRLKIPELKLADIDRWLSLDEMKSGGTRTGKKIMDPALYRKFDASLCDGFAGVPESIALKRKDFLACIDVKPGFCGISFDVKKFLGIGS